MQNAWCRSICWTSFWNKEREGVGLEHLLLAEHFADSFPIGRAPISAGERRQFRMAWICAPDLTIQPQPQAYTRLADRLYLFESLDGSGFQAELPVDDEGIVLDYPDLFRRVRSDG